MSAAIPDQWSEIKFEDFTTLQRSKDLTRSQFREGTIPVAGSNGVIGYHDTAIAKAPGITVGRSGSVGKVTVYNENFWPHNTSLYVRDFHGNDPYFAGYLLESLNLTRFKTGASVPTLDRNSFKTLPVLVPPLLEQKKITYILSTVQRAIEAQERIIQTTTELKKTLMHKLFTEGLRNEPQKQTEIGPVPESWEFTKIGEIAQLKSGGTPSRKNSAYWDGGDIGWIKTGEVDYNRIVRTEEKITKAGLEGSSAKIFPAGTLLIAMYGQGVTRGKVAITGMDAATNQACAAIFPLAEVRTKYLYYFLEYNYDTIRSFAHGANQKNLSTDLIKSFPIVYPSIASEQREIAGALGIIDRRIAVAQTKKRQLQDLFRTLLHDLMTAKIRVTTTTNGTTDHEKVLY